MDKLTWADYCVAGMGLVAVIAAIKPLVKVLILRHRINRVWRSRYRL